MGYGQRQNLCLVSRIKYHSGHLIAFVCVCGHLCVFVSGPVDELLARGLQVVGVMNAIGLRNLSFGCFPRHRPESVPFSTINSVFYLSLSLFLFRDSNIFISSIFSPIYS